MMVAGIVQYESDDETVVTCPFDGCDWSRRLAYPDSPDADMMAEHKAITHYEREHAGRCRIRVVLESEQLLRHGTLEERIDRAHDRWADKDLGLGWDVAYVLGEVIEPADDHDNMRVVRGGGE